MSLDLNHKSSPRHRPHKCTSSKPVTNSSSKQQTTKNDTTVECRGSPSRGQRKTSSKGRAKDDLEVYVDFHINININLLETFMLVTCCIFIHYYFLFKDLLSIVILYSSRLNLDDSDAFDTDLEDEDEETSSDDEAPIKAPNELLMEVRYLHVLSLSSIPTC